MRVIIFGIFAGAAFQAWRNYPPDGLVTSTSATFLAALAVVLAFFVGYRWGAPRRASATAVAVASADSTSAAAAQSAATVNVFNVQPGQGASPANLSVPVAEHVPWLDDQPRALAATDLDALDLGSILDEQRSPVLDD